MSTWIEDMGGPLIAYLRLCRKEKRHIRSGHSTQRARPKEEHTSISTSTKPSALPLITFRLIRASIHGHAHRRRTRKAEDPSGIDAFLQRATSGSGRGGGDTLAAAARDAAPSASETRQREKRLYPSRRGTAVAIDSWTAESYLTCRLDKPRHALCD